MIRVAKFAATAATLMLPLGICSADPSKLLNGAYEVVSRLEIPHVEEWAVDNTTQICLSGVTNGDGIPIPVLSTNNPYAKCAARNLVAGDTAIEYDIVCPGRASAKAHASYILNEGGFSGRIAMVLGGKNMTMTEVVHGRRIGACDYQSLKSAERF
jgi:hypothetical protein